MLELYTAFKEKHPNVNIGFAKFCALRLAFVCVCSVMLLVDAMDWDLTYKDLGKKIVSNPRSNKCIMHQYESCPGTTTLKEFLDQELNKREDDEKFNYRQWDTMDRAILTAFAALKKNAKRL